MVDLQFAGRSLNVGKQVALDDAITTAGPGSPSFVGILRGYWYVCLVVLVLVVVMVVFLCACVLRRKKRRLGRLQISQIQLQRVEGGRHRAIPGSNTSALELGSTGSPGSISIGQSPIPSPQPSFSSSHRSMRSSGRGSVRKKRRNHSPGHMSSGSEDTIRPSNRYYSASSLASSVSTLGPTGGRLHRAESFSSGRGSDRGGHGNVYRSNSQVKVTGLTESPLHSAASTLSMASAHSRPSSQLAGLIKVDVKVHLGQEEADPCQIAAALAESARQLAQSAANFEQEEEWNSHSPHYARSSSRGSVSVPQHPHLSRRQLFSNNSTPVLQRDNQNPLPVLRPGPTVSLDRPGPTVSLDRPGPTVSLDRPRRNSTAGYNSKFYEHTIIGTQSLERTAMPRRVNGIDHTPNGFQTTNRYHDNVFAATLQIQEGISQPVNMESGMESGAGTDSNASTLKAQSCYGAFQDSNEGPANKVRTSGIDSDGVNGMSEGVNGTSVRVNGFHHSSQLSLLSEQGSSEEVASPHSSLCSALSLDPQLSSTGSGYAATGSTGSGYAATGSTGSGYAATGSTGSGYAATGSTGSGYAATGRPGSGYSTRDNDISPITTHPEPTAQC